MSSRLFHAIVGVGLSLGVSVGCGGNVAAGDDASTADAAAAEVTPDTSAPDPDTHVAETESADTRVADTLVADTRIADTLVADTFTADTTLVADTKVSFDTATTDALADAFCDTAWPTTKGSPKPPACIDPDSKCTGQPPIECHPQLGDNLCQYAGATYGACVGGAWACPAGTLRSNDCKCYAPLPTGFMCTPTGLNAAPDAATDAAADGAMDTKGD